MNEDSADLSEVATDVIKCLEENGLDAVAGALVAAAVLLSLTESPEEANHMVGFIDEYHREGTPGVTAAVLDFVWGKHGKGGTH